MIELLKVLGEWLGFFFREGRYRLINSEVGGSFGDALVEFASEDLVWRLVRDRSQIFLDCRPVRGNPESSEWFSADLLVRLCSGRRVDSAVLTEQMAHWFEENLSQIEGRFSPGSLNETAGDLKKLKSRRSRELFG